MTTMRRASLVVLVSLAAAAPAAAQYKRYLAEGATGPFFATKVFLDLHVRVKSEWREDEGVLKDIGL